MSFASIETAEDFPGVDEGKLATRSSLSRQEETGALE